MQQPVRAHTHIGVMASVSQLPLTLADDKYKIFLCSQVPFLTPTRQITHCSSSLTTPLSMQSSIFLCLSQARINWEGCSRRASDVKMGGKGGDGGGSIISSDGVAPIRIVGVSASVIFPCTIKSRRFLLAPAQAGSPGKMAVKWLCVCVFAVHPSFTMSALQ